MQMAMQEAKVVVEMEWKAVAVAALHQVVEEASMGAEALGEELTFQVEEAAVVHPQRGVQGVRRCRVMVPARARAPL